MLYMEEIFSISEDGKELLKCSPQAIGLIKILEGIETIKCNAFENCCDIEGVVIPSSVNKIEQNAFFYCRYVEKHLDTTITDLTGLATDGAVKLSPFYLQAESLCHLAMFTLPCVFK